jgi:hypothetical protein
MGAGLRPLRRSLRGGLAGGAPHGGHGHAHHRPGPAPARLRPGLRRRRSRRPAASGHRRGRPRMDCGEVGPPARHRHRPGRGGAGPGRHGQGAVRRSGGPPHRRDHRRRGAGQPGRRHLGCRRRTGRRVAGRAGRGPRRPARPSRLRGRAPKRRSGHVEHHRSPVAPRRPRAPPSRRPPLGCGCGLPVADRHCRRRLLPRRQHRVLRGGSDGGASRQLARRPGAARPLGGRGRPGPHRRGWVA